MRVQITKMMSLDHQTSKMECLQIYTRIQSLVERLNLSSFRGRLVKLKLIHHSNKERLGLLESPILETSLLMLITT